MKISILMTVMMVLGTGSVALADGKPSKSTPELVAKGNAAFQVNCAACHGAKGAGDGAAAAALNPKPRNLATEKFKAGDTPQKIFNTISKGLPGTVMPGFGHLSEEERWALTHFIASLRKK